LNLFGSDCFNPGRIRFRPAGVGPRRLDHGVETERVGLGGDGANQFNHRPMLSTTSAMPLTDAAARRTPSAAFNSTDSDTSAYRPRMRQAARMFSQARSSMV
jgi:hypothetical protein